MANSNQKSQRYTWFIPIAAVIILFGIFWSTKWGNHEETKPVATATYSQDTTIEGNYNILKDERVLVKDGATLTVTGDMNLLGMLDCENGPLNLVVEGNLDVSGEFSCERADNLPSGDVGQGIMIVAKSDINFSNNAQVVSNGHVQIVDDEANFAKTQEELDEVFADAARDDGEGFRVGPFVPIEIDQETVLDLSPTKLNELSLLQKGLTKVVKGASAAPEPAADIDNLPVANTVKLAGKWYVGFPAFLPPPQVNIPTPPRDIKKILVIYHFGNNKNVTLADFELSGPDGRPGQDDRNASCTAKGDKGENAFRMRVTANNLTVNKFTLNLGSGGEGGMAETKKDCDPGKATGGQGGEASNLKMTADRNFNITGEFRIRPGQGGRGGDAWAYGKDGKDGCPAEDGKDALAYGGQGGDNKKGLKIKGTVNGIANIIIENITAGRGGDAWSVAGSGGIGQGPACLGGNGGKATAVGGQGGDAASRTVASFGGDGGDADAQGGLGGPGGTGDAKNPGGNGGIGGNADAAPGDPGQGKTMRGAAGTETANGGDGGDGGNGCPEGKGGIGGQADNPGAQGADGKNICPVAGDKKPAVKVGGDVKPGDKKDDGGAAGGVVPVQIVPLQLVGNDFFFEHKIGSTKCPTPVGNSQVEGTPGYSWRTVGQPPMWLNLTGSGTFPGSINIEFSCSLDTYETQELNTSVPIQQYDPEGNPVGDPVNLNVSGYIEG